MKDLVVADIGGTHARFAIARLSQGRVQGLSHIHTVRTADHAGLDDAWLAFAQTVSKPLPRAAALAVAGPVGAETLRFTNNPWVIDLGHVSQTLAPDGLTIVNDFAAVAHAVSQLPPSDFAHLCGPDIQLPAQGVISVIGPGTGLGVAQLIRHGAEAIVIPTEGGHIDFAPLDATDDAILAHLRKAHRRVSAERVASGPGFAAIYQALAALDGRMVKAVDEPALWTAALTGKDPLAIAALERFCLSLGAIAGDIALAQGASGVVVAGGLGQRLAAHLPRSGFAGRFVAKGRFERMMAQIPVKLLTHPQPGLFGAAAAFATDMTTGEDHS